MKTITWFSCGITSAVACKIALEVYKNVDVVYIGIDSAHKDNERFIADCEKWYGQEIKTVTNTKGYKTQFDVIEDTKYINGAYGARCTLELKKKVREKIQGQYNRQVSGFEFSQKEINRAIRFKQNYPSTNPVFPLIDRKLNKNECAGILAMQGIELPEMYKLGYNNNNCIGCVKGGAGYWNKIKQDFPIYFRTMAKLEREVGHTCIKGQYLDELPKTKGHIPKAVIPACGVFCQAANVGLIDPRAKQIFDGDLDICEV